MSRDYQLRYNTPSFGLAGAAATALDFCGRFSPRVPKLATLRHTQPNFFFGVGIQPSPHRDTAPKK
jgi:hypothetical protein